MILQALTTYPVVHLAEVLTSIENGARPSGGVDQIRTGVPSIGGEHLDNDGGFDFSNIRYIPAEFLDRMSKGIIQPHDILVVKDGATTGKVSFVGDDFPYPVAAINEHIFILRTDPNSIWPEYVFFFLFSSWGHTQILRSFHGGAIGGINQDFVNLVQIPIPSLPEQQRIATILRHVVDLRRQRHEADRQSQKLLPALFKEMFGDPVRPYKEWKETHLDDFVDITASLVNPEREEYLQLPHIGSDNIEEQTGRLFNLRSIGEVGSISGKFLFSEKHVLYSKIRPVLRKVATPEFTGLCSADIYPLSFDPGQVTKQFLAQLLRTNHFTAFVVRVSGRAQIPKVNREDLLKYSTLLPNIEMQQEFERRANLIISLREQREKSSEEVYFLFRSLLACAFSGELTKAWREQHQVELHAASEKHNEWLKTHGFQRATVSAEVVELPFISDNILLARLSPTQQRVFILAQNHPATHFTLQTLWESQKDENNLLDRDIIERGLVMLEALGILQRVNVPVSPTGEAFYQSIFRRVAAPPIADELRALKDRFPNVRL